MKHVSLSARRVTRAQIEAHIEALIAYLDEIDGDADAEDYDFDLEEDDPAGQCDEDGVNYLLQVASWGPGCPIADGGI